MKENWINDMRRKLENHQMDPPPGLWDDICKQMGLSPEPVRKPATTKRFYWIAAAAVLALVGFFVFQNINDSEQPQQANAVSQQPTFEQRTSEQIVSEQTVPEQPASQPLAEKGSVAQESQAKAPLLALVRHQSPVAESETETKETETKEEVLPESDSPAEPQQMPDEPKQTADDSQQMPNEPQQASVEPKQTTNLAQKVEWPDDLFIAESNDMQTQNKWSLGLNASGGLLAANNSVQIDDFNKLQIQYPVSEFGNNAYSDYQESDLGKNVYSDFHARYVSKHHLPVRFGLSVQYQLNNRLALHSGINYTYLYSEFSDGNDQKLHYLGIPLGLVWQLWATNHVRFYLSGGAMVEKCIRADFEGGSIGKKPWQWSVNAAAGAEYTIIRQLGVYLEPSLGYYFDDGTFLEHYYKEHSLTPSVEFGLRLHLNND